MLVLVLSLLTKPLAGPPVWLLESGELNIRVQPESVVQVRGATLWLADDVKIWKAAHAVCFSIVVDQVFSKRVPQLLEHGAKALRVVRVQVCPVRIWGNVPRVFLIPAGVLDAGQEFAWDDGKHLKDNENRRAWAQDVSTSNWNRLRGA